MRRNGVPDCLHGKQELHISLVSAQPKDGWVEQHSFPIDHHTTGPVVPEDALGVAPDTPGTGVAFGWDKLDAAADSAGLRRT